MFSSKAPFIFLSCLEVEKVPQKKPIYTFSATHGLQILSRQLGLFQSFFFLILFIDVICSDQGLVTIYLKADQIVLIASSYKLFRSELEVSLVQTFGLWRLFVYTKHDFHLILGFKISSQGLNLKLGFNNRLSTQTVVFTLNLV